MSFASGSGDGPIQTPHEMGLLKATGPGKLQWAGDRWAHFIWCWSHAFHGPNQIRNVNIRGPE